MLDEANKSDAMTASPVIMTASTIAEEKDHRTGPSADPRRFPRTALMAPSLPIALTLCTSGNTDRGATEPSRRATSLRVNPADGS